MVVAALCRWAICGYFGVLPGEKEGRSLAGALGGRTFYAGGGATLLMVHYA